MLRHAVLEVLAICYPLPRQLRGIRRAVMVELPFTVEDLEVEAALEFQRGLGNAGFEFDDQGGSKWWKATSAGLLRVERGASAPAPRTSE
jgi:hypothetical protein